MNINAEKRRIDLRESTNVLQDCEEAVSDLQRTGHNFIICRFGKTWFMPMSGQMFDDEIGSYSCVSQTPGSVGYIPETLIGCEVIRDSSLPSWVIDFVGERVEDRL